MTFSELLDDLNSSEFSALRPMQESVLEKYSLILEGGHISKPDVAIEMPAGTGKTLVALLISEYHKRIKRRIVLLTGTKQLAKQVAEDASYLGVETFVFEGPGEEWSQKELGKYRNVEIVAIMNYWAYFNINPKPPPAEILILDDAHLAENPILGLFSIRIDRSIDKELYGDIIEIIRSLRPGHYQVIEDICRDVPSSSPFLLPFYDWLSLQDKIIEILDTAVRRRNKTVCFVWPSIRLNSDSLALYVTPQEIQIRPTIFPTRTFRHFNEPLQRIYFSATLGDPQDFQRRLGCGPIHLIQPSDPQPGERGRRMIILFPSKEEGTDQEEIIRNGLKKVWPDARRRLWMCSSWREAEYWKQWVPPLKDGTRTHIFELRGADETQLEEFRKVHLGHLFTAARYDGIDLPGDQCRFAIIPGAPVTSDPQEEFFSAHLRDASFLKSRFSQRVAQALGRCNRSAADFAVYLLLDPRFERRFGGSDPDYLSYLPWDIQPEMEAALYQSEDGFEKCCERAKSFLSGNFDEWDREVEKLRLRVKRDNAPLSFKAQLEVDGWLALWNGDPVKAVEKFQIHEKECSRQNLLGPLGFIRYCLSWARYLCYIRQGDADGLSDSISLLEKAASVGPSSWFTSTLRASANDLRKVAKKQEKVIPKEMTYKDSIFDQWEMILYDRGQKEESITKWLNKILEDLQADNHDQVCEGLTKFAPLLGLDGFRPKGQGMPDTVWRFSPSPRFVITWEAKIETSPERKITINDVNQSHGHGRWAKENYSQEGYGCYPLILHRSIELERGALARLENVKCVSQDTIVALYEKIRSIFNEFRIIWNPNDPEKRLEAKHQCLNKLPSSEWLIRAISSAKKGVIDGEDLLSNWD